jgi:hypothetical protein
LAKCDLRVEIDPEHRRVRAREALQGTVFVEVDKECDCSDLFVTARWKTIGKGNVARGGETKQSLFSGQWRAGQAYEYRFDLEVPTHPLSYSGHHFDVVWAVQARADIPWAKDPKAEQTFELVPGGGGLEAPKLPKPVYASGRLLSMPFRGCLTIFLLFWFMTPLLNLIPGLFVCLVSGGIVFLLWRNILSERRLGTIQFATDPEIVCPGEELTARVTFRPRRVMTVNRLVMTLNATETAVKGGGKNSTTYRHKIVQLRESLDEPMDTLVGEPTTLTFRFDIPETNAFSFQAPSNQVRWGMKVHIHVPLWPDWKGGFPLICWPRARKTEEAFFAEAAPAPIQSEPEAAVLESPSSLEALAVELSALPSYEDGAELIERARTQTFDLELIVTNVARTFGGSFDASLRNGRTVVGRVEGVSCEVAVVFPEDQNDDVEQWSAGSSQKITGRPLEWDSISERLVLETCP